jgi:hypothetical protein
MNIDVRSQEMTPAANDERQVVATLGETDCPLDFDRTSRVSKRLTLSNVASWGPRSEAQGGAMVLGLTNSHVADGF